MNFFKRLFLKRDNIYFSIPTMILTNPKLYGFTAETVTNKLSNKEVGISLKICELLSDHLHHHFQTLRGFKISVESLNNSPAYLYKSYLEVILLDWRSMHHLFNTNTVRAELREVLYYTLVQAFRSLPILEGTTFRTIDEIFKQREETSDMIISLLMDTGTDECFLAERLYYLFIRSPLNREIDVNSWLEYKPIFNEESTNYLPFYDHFTNGIANFVSKLTKIDFSI